MNKFSNKLKKPFFPNFLEKKNFLENPTLSCTISYGFLAPCQDLMLMIQFKENVLTDRRMEGQKDGKALFYRTNSATFRGPKICTDQWLGKYFWILERIWAKQSEQVRFVPSTIWGSGRQHNPSTIFPSFNLTQNCYINKNIFFFL